MDSENKFNDRILNNLYLQIKYEFQIKRTLSEYTFYDKCVIFQELIMHQKITQVS